jgi:hypothetical protein
MITEFSFSGFPYPGHKSGLFIDVYTQENRGIGYRKYLLQAARAPFMVGMHWFMWMDYAQQDPTIRGFSPDENVGLVSHDETAVYTELGRWVSGTNAEIDATHRSARWLAAPQPEPPSQALTRFAPTVDGDVSEWPQELVIKPTLVTALADEVKVDHRYFIAWDKRYVYLAGDLSDSRLDHPGKDWAWQGDYLAVQVSPVKPGARRADSSSVICIYPHGGGADGQQPYAARCDGPQGEQALAIRVKRQLRPAGYSVEARIPASAIGGLQGKAGALWQVKLMYQNVNELYRTHWEGLVRLSSLAHHRRIRGR